MEAGYRQRRRLDHAAADAEAEKGPEEEEDATGETEGTRGAAILARDAEGAEKDRQ